MAILISALGLVAMSTYYIQQKEQEVAVRKVFGSTRGEVLVRLWQSSRAADSNPVDSIKN